MFSKRGKGEHITSSDAPSAVQRVTIDLQMAQTYIPAFFCVFKSAVLVLVLCNPNVTNNIPIQTTLLIMLYIDRALRSEAVFDSSAILCNILIFYIINNFRSHEEPTHGFYLSDTTVPILCHLLQSSYCISSVLLFTEVDIFVSLHNLLPTTRVYGIFRTHAKPYSVVVQGIILAFLVHIPEKNLLFDSQFVATRSFSFLLACISWSYISGVPSMIRLLQHMKKPLGVYNTNEKGNIYDTSPIIVQSFAQCQLMFTPILFVTDIYFYLIMAIFSVVSCHRIYSLGIPDNNLSDDYLTTTRAHNLDSSGNIDLNPHLGKLPVMFAQTLMPNNDTLLPISINPVPIYMATTPTFHKSPPPAQLASSTSSTKDDTLELFRRAQQNASKP
jgi:hypothetical protein